MANKIPSSLSSSSPSSSSSPHCIKELSRACFHGCCAKPSFCSFPSEPSPSQHNFIVATLSSLHPNTPEFTDHESLPPLHESLAYFTGLFPQFAESIPQVEEIRSRDYYHLALSNHVCLDYVGVGLFSHPSTPQVGDREPSNFFNICHKAVSLKSQLLHGSHGSELELDMRKKVMDFMNVSEDDYTVIFTSNQTSAFKLIAESYPFHTHHNLITVYDHLSEALEAMSESSKQRGARVSSAEFSWPSMAIRSMKLRKVIEATNKTRSSSMGLFVFPLQSRMTGSRYSYQWMSFVRENGFHVLLDACALGPKDMQTLGLSLFKPDFLVCSFYKIFGENPSGFGCLFVKKSTSSILTDSDNASTSIGIVNLKSRIPSFTTKCTGLDHAESLGLVTISSRSRLLINWLVNALTRLRHPCSDPGTPLIRIYGPRLGFDRGPSVAFNVFDWKGEKVDPKLVQKLADRNNISLSYGFLKHVWFKDKSEEERERRVESCEGESEICSVTVTLGLVTNFEDVYRIWAFVARFLDADFVEKERWRYLALNQTTIEV